jgi:FlaA1/EpsC-like NDP-sugar epimerase
MLLVVMVLVSAAMKTYHDPITANFAYSVFRSVGAFALSLGVTALLLLLIDSRRLNIMLLINLLFYSVFLLGTYRVALCIRFESARAAGGENKRTGRKGLCGQTWSDFGVEELLGRADLASDTGCGGGYLADSTVLITGGAGTVGFELCSQVLRQNARLVVIYDQNENKLYEAETELSLKYPRARFATCVGSVQDRARLREVFDLYRPQTVFHAASYKNSQVMEQNPNEALKNNVMGTLYMVEMAIKYRTDRFVLLSDDMAYQPTSILGASRRVAEMLIQRANEWGNTLFSAVRFPAAVGSCGGIVQLFKKQIQSGGPVYVSDTNADTYLMTVPEAVKLILKSGGMIRGGEIFSLGRGDPVNLHELARAMIVRYGLRPDRDIKIVTNGCSQRGKTVESSKNGTRDKADSERNSIIRENERPPVTFEEVFDKLCQSIDDRDYGSAMGKVSVLVPSFRNLRS